MELDRAVIQEAEQHPAAVRLMTQPGGAGDGPDVAILRRSSRMLGEARYYSFFLMSGKAPAAAGAPRLSISYTIALVGAQVPALDLGRMKLQP